MNPKDAIKSIAQKLSDWVNTLPPSARNAVIAETQAQVAAIEKAMDKPAEDCKK